MSSKIDSRLTVLPKWQPLFHAAGLFNVHQLLNANLPIVWRVLKERKNATLDLPNPQTSDGKTTRFHIKIFAPNATRRNPVQQEIAAWNLLQSAGIPTLDLVAHGHADDGRSVTVTADLTGYESAQTLLRKGVTFDAIAGPTAALAAQLHAKGLHHQDLYLCHFFLRTDHLSDPRLIDITRVGLLGTWFAKRWIVKDLAQFRYSAAEFQIPDHQLNAWLDSYAEIRQIAASSLLPAIESKTARIARHDAQLKSRQPLRNISLPPSPLPDQAGR